MAVSKKLGRPVHSTGQAGVISTKQLKQIRKFIGVSDPDLVARNNMVVSISYFLGLRAKEIASLRIKDVFDGEHVADVLRLISSYTKGQKHRDVFISNTKLRADIQAYIDYRLNIDGEYLPETALVRSRKGSFFSAASMSRMITDIYKNAGFHKLSSHSGRRSMITDLAHKGIDINSLRILAGHSSIQTTQRYIEHSPTMLSDILKAR